MLRSTESPIKYHELNFDDGRILNAQQTSIPHIGTAITIHDITYLKKLDQIKTEFVHTVSHDLRSPLTAVLGYTELVSRVGPLNEQQQEFLRRIQASVQSITTLINELLDLGRLEAGFDIAPRIGSAGECLSVLLRNARVADYTKKSSRGKKYCIQFASLTC